MKSVRKIMGALLACTMAFPAMSTAILPEKSLNVSAVQSEWKFDLGGSGTESGYMGVSATDSYSKSAGYGFANTSGVKNVSSSGKGALSDAVQFTSGDPGNTFNVDLPKGLYQITVTTGDTSRTSIRAEGMLQLINLTGNNAVETFQCADSPTRCSPPSQPPLHSTSTSKPPNRLADGCD